MGNRPTMSDVATAAGVHKATASRALNPDTSGLVNAATARRVLAAARELGYTPNTMARGLRTSRSHTVGVLIPDLTNPLFPPIVRGIENALSARDYTALIANTDNDDAQETSRFEALLGRHVDGLILATGRREHPLLQSAHERGVRVVLVNRGTERPLYPVVTGDDAAGIAAAVDHLTDLGHRRLLHLAGPAELSTGAVRARAFRQAVTARQVDGAVVTCSSYSIRAGEETMRAALSQDRRRQPALDRGPVPTGIVAGNDLIALGALRAVRSRGLRCPADISVVGYNDMPFLDEVDPPLTSVHVPHHELGAEAARLLLHQLDGTPSPSKTITLPVHLVIRASTAPPAR